MRKFYTLFIVITSFAFAALAQDPAGCTPLGTMNKTLDPALVPKFTNDLPVIKNLGLRVDLTQQNPAPLAVKMEETTQDLLGLGIQTKVWGYRFPGLPATYPGATIVAMKDQPVEIKWKNKLPGHFLPVDPTMHMAHPSYIHDVAGVRAWYAEGNVPTVAHLHGGHTESDSDGLPEAWFTQKNEYGNFYVKKDYLYHNDQEAATLWYHDHALGITRLNVYAGLAGFYLLRDANEEALIADNTLPGEDYEIEVVIQDRLFDQQGQLFWPSYPGEVPYDDFIFGEGAILPPATFPNGGPSALAEFFGNIILVNGKAWPKLDVEPRKYRLRLLNGSDSRFYILKLDNDSPIMVIGTDDGLMEKPVNVDELVFAPGERYDVVIDFTGLTGNSIKMINLGPDEPYGGGTPGIDFDPACPSTTGQIMQFNVNKTLSNVPNALVNTGSTLNSIVPLVAENADNTRQLVLFEGKDEFGRLQPMLGTMENGSQTWSEAITENPVNNSTEIWEVYNATGDAHPIHLHLVKFQILNRQSFAEYDGEGYEDNIKQRPQIQHNGSFGIGADFKLNPVTPFSGDPVEPLDYEKGWKDSFIVPPGEVGRLIAHFDREGRYVWHCHILSHEDHEMMRPFQVIPSSVLKSAPLADQDGPEQDRLGEFQLYPNPASVSSTVEFALAETTDVTIRLYDLDGRMVKSAFIGSLSKGNHQHTLNVDDLSSGMYLFEFNAGSKQYIKTIIISK